MKLPPPFDVEVTKTEGSYNFSWDHDNKEDCLQYIVRIRESNDLSKVIMIMKVDLRGLCTVLLSLVVDDNLHAKLCSVFVSFSQDPVYSLFAEEKHILLKHEKFSQHSSYTVDVQTRYCPGVLYEGPWSEWSSTAELTTGIMPFEPGTRIQSTFISSEIRLLRPVTDIFKVFMREMFLRVCVSALLHHTKYHSETGLQSLFILQLLLLILFFHIISPLQRWIIYSYTSPLSSFLALASC